MPMDFTIQGRIKPYVRMTQRSKYSDMQAQEYLACKLALGMQFKYQMDEPQLPGQTPLAVTIHIWEGGGFHNKDLDNQVKTILDAMSGIVYPDDRWIDRIVAERERAANYHTTVRIETL